MRKSILTDAKTENPVHSDHEWLDLEYLAQVQLSSEDPAYPVEAALSDGGSTGWKAAEPGRQSIRLLFDAPLRIRRIKVMFCEREAARTQEFILRWSAEGDSSFREIVRQQYNFSPPDSTCETEEYAVDLSGVVSLELVILPDISGGDTPATLAQLRIA